MRTRIPDQLSPSCKIGNSKRELFWCGRAVDHQSLGFMREDSLARIHAGETNGNVILEQTQPDPPLVVHLLVA